MALEWYFNGKKDKITQKKRQSGSWSSSPFIVAIN